MTRKELAEKLAAEYGTTFKTIKDADNVLKCVFYLIGAELVTGREVLIDKFGAFKVAERSERRGRNPRTGEEITIPAHKTITFSAYKPLKAAVNE